MRESDNISVKTAANALVSDNKGNAKDKKRNRLNYHSIFNQASDAIFVTDFEGNFIDVNASVCAMFGYTKKELLLRKVMELVEPEQLRERPIVFNRIATGEHIFTSRRMVRKDGAVLDMEINVKKFGYDQILVIARDVTEMVRARQMVQMSEARFRGAFEHSAIGMAIVSLSGRWVQVNKELCELTGYNEAELLLLSFQELTHPEDRGSDILPLQELKNGSRELYRTEKRYLHKDGSTIWINLNVSAVKSDDGHAMYFVSQIENITARIKIAEELREKADLLQLFVANSPAAIAMFDRNMNYIQVSKRWIIDYGLVDKEIIGKNHYNVFPTIPKVWRDIHQRCMEGANERCEEDSFVREDGTREWLKWEVLPWKQASGEIGGIIMLTEVITKNKETQLKFRDLVEKSLVGVYILQNGKFAYANPRLVEESGYTEQELTGMSIEEFVHREDVEIFQRNIRARLDGEIETIRYDVRVKRKDGQTLWMEIFGTTTLYEGSAAIIGTMVNITEKKAVYNDLIKSEANLKSIFNTTQISYLLLDHNYAIISYNDYFSEGYLEQTGYELVPGISFLDLVMPEKRENVRKSLESVWHTGKPMEYETSYMNTGKIKYYHVIVTPVSTGGSTIGFCVAGQDITNRKNMEIERQKILVDFFNRNRDLQEFAQIVSHNLRSPLVTILGLINVFKGGASELDKDFILDGVAVSAEKLDSVVMELNNILNVKSESSDNKTIIDLNEAVKKITGRISNLLVETMTIIETDFTEVNELFSIRSFIDYIFYNLISNSIKYRDKTRTPYIRIWSERTQSGVVLAIRDNGIGIDMNKHEDQLFMLNKRFHNSSEGKGLGLFIVKAQVDVLNGTIEIDSTPGVGTTIKIILPV